MHVRIVQGSELIADLPDWTGPLPVKGDYLFHPPWGAQGIEGIAGCVKTRTWRMYARSGEPGATSFVQTVDPYVEISI